MTYSERDQLIDEILNLAKDVRTKKGQDYAGLKDPNANFKNVAKRLGLTKFQIWSVYFLKQVDAIINSIKDNPDKPVTSGEPLEQRIIDVINYASILYTLLEDSDG